MSQKRLANLVKVKNALAEKYDRLAAKACSKPKRRTYKNLAEKFRRQVQQLERT
jgi:hypothetical protein